MKKQRLNKYEFTLKKYVQNTPIDVLTVETNANKKPLNNVKYNELRRLERTLSKEFRTKVSWRLIPIKKEVTEIKPINTPPQKLAYKHETKRRANKKYRYELVLKSDEFKDGAGRRDVYKDVFIIDAESDYTPINNTNYTEMLRKKKEIELRGYMTRIHKRSHPLIKEDNSSFINKLEKIVSMRDVNITEGSILKHSTANYIAIVKKINSDNTGVLNVIYADGDFGIHCPFEINAKEINKYFTLIK
jgi:hypothetical protein